jgi:hypothetical protein
MHWTRRRSSLVLFQWSRKQYRLFRGVAGGAKVDGN